MQKQSKIFHNYLLEADPFKDINSIARLIDENLFETGNKDILVINKPPGFVLSSRNLKTFAFEMNKFPKF